MLSYEWYPISVVLSMLSYQCYPINVILSILPYQHDPMVLSILSYRCCPINVIISMLSGVTYQFHHCCVILSYNTILYYMYMYAITYNVINFIIYHHKNAMLSYQCTLHDATSCYHINTILYFQSMTILKSYPILCH